MIRNILLVVAISLIAFLFWEIHTLKKQAENKVYDHIFIQTDDMTCTYYKPKKNRKQNWNKGDKK